MRIEAWRDALNEEIDQSREMPFAYGTNDCLQFCARCIAAMTGVDTAAPFGVYTSELGAAKLMLTYGGVSGILTEAFGESTAPNFARVGDVITATIDGLETAGVCCGLSIAFTADGRGLAFLPRECIEKTWIID